MKTTRYTFWKLVDEHFIEIPIIQRDYAQGRDDSKTREIRNKLLSDLFNTISENKNLDFDFVYGSLINNKFIPLDGQQRLTTLFLLHWYIAMKEGKIEDFRNKLLVDNNSKFTYSTRTTAKDFCNELIAHEVAIPDKGIPLSDKIKDSSWFFLYWEKDPTIKSMLVMLDAIHEKFNHCEHFFEKLVHENAPIITFQFIDLPNFGLTDDLYIKMNARGKQLTDFENFKAKFEQLLEKEYPILLDDFRNKIDGKWTDLFWYYKNDKNLFDEQFLNFFRVMVTNYYASSENGHEDNLSLLIGTIPLSFSKYQELQCFDENSINEITETLDCLQNGINKIKVFLPDTTLLNEGELFKKVIEYTLSLKERVQFFGLIKYLIKNASTTNDGLSDWMRVIRNLSENTLYNNPDEYSKSIKSITKLLANCQDILNFISNSDNEISGFFQPQVIEERIKALLILKGKEWRDSVTELENHRYFKGQIGFILKFAGITNFYESNNKTLRWSDEQNNKYSALFKNYSQKAQAMFGENGIKVIENNMWERALISKGDYLLQLGSNHTFLINGMHRDISWKRLLRDNNKKTLFIKQLFDDEEFDVNNIPHSLDTIIKKSVCVDWRRYFIEIPEICNYLGRNKNIRFNSEHRIYLLRKERMSGTHAEYYSYSFYIKNLKRKPLEPFKRIQYNSVSGEGTLPIIFIGGWKYKESKISILIFCLSQEKNFGIELRENDKKPLDEHIINILKLNNFQLVEDSFVIYLHENEVEEKLNLLCKSLQGLSS